MGRFQRENYNPLTYEDNWRSGTMLVLGTVHVPEHPIMQGVKTFNGGGYSGYVECSVQSYAMGIVDWNNGAPLVAMCFNPNSQTLPFELKSIQQTPQAQQHVQQKIAQQQQEQDKQQKQKDKQKLRYQALANVDGSKIVALNMACVSSKNLGSCWQVTTDGAKLMLNALFYSMYTSGKRVKQYLELLHKECNNKQYTDIIIEFLE